LSEVLGPVSAVWSPRLALTKEDASLLQEVSQYWSCTLLFPRPLLCPIITAVCIEAVKVRHLRSQHLLDFELAATFEFVVSVPRKILSRKDPACCNNRPNLSSSV
jgi:hypothetical protein